MPEYSLDLVRDLIRQAPDADLLDIQILARDERQDRPARQAAEAAANAAALELLDQLGVEPPAAAALPDDVDNPDTDTTLPQIATIAAWEDPQGDRTKAYRQGAVVRHNERVWLNVNPYINTWEPGAPGSHQHDTWQDITWRWEQQQDDDGTAAEPAVEPDGTINKPYPWHVGLELTLGQYTILDGITYRMEQPSHIAVAHYRPDAPGMTSIYKPVG